MIAMLGLPTRRLIQLGMIFLAFLVILFPMSVALPIFDTKTLGLAARQASGTLWWGKLRDTTVAGFPLGDVRAALRPFPLFVGSAQIEFAAPTIQGLLRMSAGSFGVDNATGSIDSGTLFNPLPLGRLELNAVTVRFRGDDCARADGKIRASIAGELGGIALPGGMTGILKCDGTELLMPLASQSGMEQVVIHVRGSGKWRGRISIRSSDPAQIEKLTAAGFREGQGGFQLGLSGQL